jgi:adenosylmethionine-8-amino-7-oxononanoate aminotransferase
MAKKKEYTLVVTLAASREPVVTTQLQKIKTKTGAAVVLVPIQLTAASMQVVQKKAIKHVRELCRDAEKFFNKTGPK